MKRTALFAAALVLCAGTTALAQVDRTKDTKPATTTSQPVKPGAVKAQPGADEMAQKMAAFGAVTENHKILEKFAGKWDTTVKCWMNPGETPTESTGTAEQKLVYGGRFIHSNFAGDFMGQKFEGFGVMGYNNVAKAYQYSFHSNMGTSVDQLNGRYDPSTKTFTFAGEMTCPIDADGKVTARNTLRWTGDNSFVEEMYMNGPDGKEIKSMEITYKRSGTAKADAASTDKAHN